MKQRAQPTSYKNEAEQQTAGILFKLIIATGLGFLFGGLIGIYIKDVMAIVTMAVGITLLIVPFILLRRRQVISAGTILILVVIGTLTASATMGQGLNDLAIFAFPITYFFASMFMNRNVFRICLAFSILAIFWLAFGELNGWFVPKPAIPISWVNFSIVLVILLITAFVSDLLATKMRKNLERAEQEITQRRQVEQELIKEQALLKTTLEATADGILVVARDGTWSIFNQKFLDMWGIPAAISETRDDEAALNHVVGSLAHPEEFAAKVKELYENIEMESLDIVELKDGRTFKRYSQPQRQNEEIVGRAWSFRDITERKQAEEKFTQQSIQRQKLLIMGRQITSSLDTDQVFNYISEQVRILLGSYGVTIYMLDSQGKELIPVLTYPPDYSEQVLSTNLDLDSSLTGRVIKARQGMIFNYADEQSDSYHIPGTPIDEDHLMIAPFIINEEAVGSLNIYREHTSFNEEDLALAETFTLYASTAINNARAHQELLDQIADRKQAEEALRESEEKYRLIVENANDGIEITQDDKVLFSNARFAEMLGYTTSEILNKKFSRFFTKQAIQSLHEREKKRKNKIPVPTSYETSFRKKDGTIIYVDVKYEITTYKEKPATFAIVRDITERKKAEEVLTESASLRELLLDIITHDLRNPASNIYALSETARKELPDNKFLEAIYASSGHLIEVFNQTTILSQATFGETIPKEPLSLNNLLQESADEFAFAMSSAGLELVITSAPDLIIEANPLIAEVFKNFISNAIKYATDGKRIEIETVIEDQTVIVYVKDFGKTIAEADRDQIFERQIQLENGKERGRGLGLAIVKRIALAHDGEVWVEPNTPVGNSFCLRIPL